MKAHRVHVGAELLNNSDDWERQIRPLGKDHHGGSIKPPIATSDVSRLNPAPGEERGGGTSAPALYRQHTSRKKRERNEIGECKSGG